MCHVSNGVRGDELKAVSLSQGTLTPGSVHPRLDLGSLVSTDRAKVRHSADQSPGPWLPCPVFSLSRILRHFILSPATFFEQSNLTARFLQSAWFPSLPAFLFVSSLPSLPPIETVYHSVQIMCLIFSHLFRARCITSSFLSSILMGQFAEKVLKSLETGICSKLVKCRC